MSDTKRDENGRDEVLKRMLGMAPKPHGSGEREPGKPSPRRVSKEEVENAGNQENAGSDLDLDHNPK
jgi:hypothetical protein